METDSDGEEDDTCSPIGWQGMWGGGVIEQKGKSNHGHGQQCGDCWGEEDKGPMVMEKNTIKIKWNESLFINQRWRGFKQLHASVTWMKISTRRIDVRRKRSVAEFEERSTHRTAPENECKSTENKPLWKPQLRLTAKDPDLELSLDHLRETLPQKVCEGAQELQISGFRPLAGEDPQHSFRCFDKPSIHGYNSAI